MSRVEAAFSFRHRYPFQLTSYLRSTTRQTLAAYTSSIRARAESKADTNTNMLVQIPQFMFHHMNYPHI